VTHSQFIPVSAPALVGNEKKYVMDCLESAWISSNGKYIDLFEASFREFCGTRHAISCSNGTVALHVPLVALNVQPGDEVLVPALTFVATANAVTYCGARPVFVDSEPGTWNMDPQEIARKITPRTKGIIVVHLYGHPADMDRILAVAKAHNLFVIEDAAEAHGAEYKGKRVGGIGRVGTFSFYGNKIVTTGEGGMIVTNDDALAVKMRQLKGQGVDPSRRYWFPVIGYNYRMTNIAAAIGLAQMEKAEWHMERRHEVSRWYREELQDLKSISWQPELDWATHANWMFTIVLNSPGVDRERIMADMLECGIESRPGFYPMHMLPPYEQTQSEEFPVATHLGTRSISLPTWAGLSRNDVQRICQTLRRCLNPGS
jgi:perosamine synthetase